MTDSELFVKMVAQRQWKNGWLVPCAKKLQETGQLDLSMVESRFVVKYKFLAMDDCVETAFDACVKDALP